MDCRERADIFGAGTNLQTIEFLRYEAACKCRLLRSHQFTPEQDMDPCDYFETFNWINFFEWNLHLAQLNLPTQDVQRRSRAVQEERRVRGRSTVPAIRKSASIAESITSTRWPPFRNGLPREQHFSLVLPINVPPERKTLAPEWREASPREPPHLCLEKHSGICVGESYCCGCWDIELPRAAPTAAYPLGYKASPINHFWQMMEPIDDFAARQLGGQLSEITNRHAGWDT
ncbi:hypothetical protein chiPu_0001489 [Chiloscyllium punctatum]|uniref:Uncharacterized protein n=1 Tax=Chiloscyllium punctatum TaxID=137246 RepID=A0A401RY65_CHIPU|nr:hypothetical protein [Chiloscyllium punctatum]